MQKATLFLGRMRGFCKMRTMQTIQENQNHFNSPAVDQGRPPRPVALSVRPEGIPTQLKSLDQWVCWRFVWRDGRWTKLPLTVTGNAADSTDPATFTTFAAALAAYQAEGFDGIGLVHLPTNELTGIDFDKCRDPQTGVIDAAVLEQIAKLDTFTEISPSSTGLRAFAFDRKPSNGHFKKGRFEIYDGETSEGKPGGRFLTLTGHHLDGTPTTINHRREQIAQVYYSHWPQSQEPGPLVTGNNAQAIEQPAAENCESSEGAEAFLAEMDPATRTTPPEPIDTAKMTDDDLLAVAKAAKNGPKFSRLMDGDSDGYKSKSEADEALCFILAYWTRGDADRIERLFSRSKLGEHDKWKNRADYRRGTINKAVQAVKSGWKPSRNGTAPTPEKATAPPPCHTVVIPPLTLAVKSVRRTAAKTIVELDLLKDGKLIDNRPVSSSTHSRNEFAKVLAKHGITDAAEAQLNELFAVVSQIDSRPGASTLPTIADILDKYVQQNFGFESRTPNGLYDAKSNQEYTRQRFCEHRTKAMFDACLATADVPRVKGEVSRTALDRAIRTEMGILYGSIAEALPDNARERFIEAVIATWTNLVTSKMFQASNGETVPRRASLIGLVWDSISTLKTKPGWNVLRDDFSVYYRTDPPREGETITVVHAEKVLRLGMRANIIGQAKVPILGLGVSDQKKLSEYASRFKVSDDDFKSNRLSTGDRLFVLSQELTLRILESPTADQQEGTDTPTADAKGIGTPKEFRTRSY